MARRACGVGFALACLVHTGGCQQGPSETLDAAPQEMARDTPDAQVAQTGPDARAPQADPDAGEGPKEPDAAEVAEPPSPNTRRPALCERPADDPVRDVFCGDALPRITGLSDLRDQLRAVQNVSQDAARESHGENIPAAVLGHSTSLSGHLVSPINPRVLLFEGGTLFAFQRGVQRVELTTQSRLDPTRNNFYLVTFEQACNGREQGCNPGDLYTERIERDWLGVTLQDDEDLKNTPADCRQCHQRGLEEPVLLMRELQGPWTHFFSPPTPSDGSYPGVSGGALVTDYQNAKGDEGYGSVSGERIANTLGLLLQSRMLDPQPLLFDAPTIERERWPYSPDGYPDEPQRSATWDRAFEAFKRGENLALPYPGARPTDPEKQATLSKAYQRYLHGELAADDLPDLADIFPEDPQVRAEIGLQVEPGATPAEALVQACGTCHNDVLDQGISRARFNIDLARMDAAGLERTVARLQRDADEVGAMPPPEARALPDDLRARLIDYLQAGNFGEEDLAFLARAARAGMAGNVPGDPDGDLY